MPHAGKAGAHLPVLEGPRGAQPALDPLPGTLMSLSCLCGCIWGLSVIVAEPEPQLIHEPRSKGAQTQAWHPPAPGLGEFTGTSA